MDMGLCRAAWGGEVWGGSVQRWAAWNGRCGEYGAWAGGQEGVVGRNGGQEGMKLDGWLTEKPPLFV